MNFRSLLHSTQRFLGKSRVASRLAVAIRNQASCVIQYHLNEDANPHKNGEAWFAQLMAQDTTHFVDVGANIGNWADLFSRSSVHPIKGILFEPSKIAFEQLSQRFAQVDHVILKNVALSDCQGQLVFYEEPDAGETSSLVAGFSNTQAAQRLVEVTTLDSEIDRLGWEHVDFLKIDTEGYDLHVLRGANQLLKTHRIGAIQFEYNLPWSLVGSTLAAAIQLLESCSYAVFLLKSDGLYQLNYALYREFFSYSNFVAISPQNYEAIAPYIKGSI